MRTVRSLFFLSIAAATFTAAGDEHDAAGRSDIASQKGALAELNPLIGKWRGVGQPRRGSVQGAWQEQAEWVWDFADGGNAVRVDIAQGKLAKTLRLTFDTMTKEYVGQLTTANGEAEMYRGRFQKPGVLVLTTSAMGDEVRQITVTRLSDIRTLVLFEKRAAAQASFQRVAEVGYTRDGARLATASTSGPECIVTGGAGTMEVKYKGETYYVCCSGCRQAFEDDPEGVIAEAAERRKREREKAK